MQCVPGANRPATDWRPQLDVYSVLLLLAMVAAAVALPGAAVIRRRGDDARFTPWADTTGRVSVLLSLLALGLHWGGGHRPGTAAALSFGGFLAAHPTPLVTMVAGAAAVWLSRPRRFGTGPKT